MARALTHEGPSELSGQTSRHLQIAQQNDASYDQYQEREQHSDVAKVMDDNYNMKHQLCRARDMALLCSYLEASSAGLLRGYTFEWLHHTKSEEMSCKQVIP